MLALRPRRALSPLFLPVPCLGLRALLPCLRYCSLLALRGLRPLVPPASTALAPRSIVRRSAVPRRFCLLSRGFESPCLPFLAGRRSRLLLLQPVVMVESPSVRFAVRLRLHPLRSPCRSYPLMADGALGLVASALADAIPGEAPGDQVPGLLRAFAVLAGRGSSSQSSRGRRGGLARRGRRGGSHQPVYHSPPGRTHAFLRPRQQQSALPAAAPSSSAGSVAAVATFVVATPATVPVCSSGGSFAFFFPVAVSSLCPCGCSASFFSTACSTPERAPTVVSWGA
ncbi:unnamed protein product [Closterium sp. Naga37s-1]|nr:unnamed protein product [Closterium sp. Naga37s-1]